MRSVAVIGVLLALVASAGAGELTAPELAAALQKRYDRIAAFSADFVHMYQGGVLHKQITERGHLDIKKPGKMRWDYTSPEPKTFVSDGVKLYSYIPQDKQVIISSVGPEDEATTPALFLAGKGNLTRDFAASLTGPLTPYPAGTLGLKLVPKTREAGYDWLILALDPGSLALRGLVTIDAEGGTSTFVFSHLKENVALPDSLFTFRIPRGVDVVTDSGR